MNQSTEGGAKECPFCGSVDVKRLHNDLDERSGYKRQSWVQCNSCNAKSAYCYPDEPKRGSYPNNDQADEKALALWNARAALKGGSDG